MDLRPGTIAAPTAAFSLDLETDFGTGRMAALSQLDRFVDLMADLAVPWTAFVEGQLFRETPRLIALLRDRGIDLQLHCYDHARPGDTPASLREGIAAFADFLGRRPAGYRAHTYRLTRPLFDTLVDEGFLWDSSVMRAFAQGRNPHRAFRRGDYLVIGDGLVEFPIATWRGLPIALNHGHLLLAKTPVELALRGLFGPRPLVVYNFHMTDLVRCDSLAAAVRTRAVRTLHRYMWSTHGADTFQVARRFVGFLRRRGYAFRTMSDLYDHVRVRPESR